MLVDRNNYNDLNNLFYNALVKSMLELNKVNEIKYLHFIITHLTPTKHCINKT